MPNILRVLAVAGYELVAPERLGEPAKVVCSQVASIADRYHRIVPLGGFGGTAGTNTTTGFHMWLEMVRLGVPVRKIILPMEMSELSGIMPARDTGEERKFLRSVLDLPEYTGAVVDSISIYLWTPRTRFIDKNLRITCRNYRSIGCLVPIGQLAREPVAFLSAWMYDDPFGTKGPLAKTFAANRNGRTPIRDSGLTPLTADL